MDQYTRKLEKYITARELESCMWTHKYASKSILMLSLVQRLSPTTGCHETRRREVQNFRIQELFSFKDL